MFHVKPLGTSRRSNIVIGSNVAGRTAWTIESSEYGNLDHPALFQHREPVARRPITTPSG